MKGTEETTEWLNRVSASGAGVAVVGLEPATFERVMRLARFTAEVAGEECYTYSESGKMCAEVGFAPCLTCEARELAEAVHE